ncbi:MAG: histidine phosphatase family protein [Pseudomonadota bacterium]
MAKRLLLMRHAKSDYPAGIDDHDRPLNRRGRLAAALMGAYLAEAARLPDLAYVSTAARAQETWARMTVEAQMEPRASLYHASAATMLEVAAEAPDGAETLLLLWHQPGIQDAANRLIGAHQVLDYATAQIVTLEVGIDRWRDLAFGGAQLVDVAAPKRLV